MMYFLYGEDAYRARKAIDALREAFTREHPQGSFDWIDFITGGVEEMKKTLESQSLFSGAQCIIGHSPFSLALPSREALLHIIHNKEIHERQNVRIAFWQPDKPDSITRLCRDLLSRSAHIQEFPVLRGDELTQYIKRMGIQKGVRLSREVLKLFIARTGENLWLVDQEIGKLASVCTDVTVKHLEDYVAPVVSPSIFLILDALAEKKRTGVYSAVHEYYAKGSSPLALLSMLLYQVRNLIKVKSLAESGVSAYRLATEAKLHPFVAQKALAQSRLFTFFDLRRIHGKIFETERAIKTGRVDAALAVDLLLGMF